MFHGAVITSKMSSKTRVFRDVSRVGRDLELLKDAKDSRCAEARVAIVFDYDNMWALDDARAYSNQSKKYWETIQHHYKAFWDMDIPVDIISTDDDLGKYSLVIDPMHFMMTEKFAGKLKKFTEDGGTLVGTYINGIVDENFLTYLGQGMDTWRQIYGLEVTETDTLYPEQKNNLEMFGKTYEVRDYCDLIEPESAEVEGTYGDFFYKGTPAVTRNGNAWYIGCRTDDGFLADFYGRLCRDLGLDFEIPLEKHSSKVSVRVRQTDDADYCFIINFSHEKQDVELSCDAEDVLLQEELNSGSLELEPYGVKVLKISR